jgi:hypothetical protein
MSIILAQVKTTERPSRELGLVICEGDAFHLLPFLRRTDEHGIVMVRVLATRTTSRWASLHKIVMDLVSRVKRGEF